MGAEWTKERDETLRTMAREGYSASRISNHFGNVTRSAVCGRAHRINVKLNGAGSKRGDRTSYGGRPKGSRQKLTCMMLKVSARSERNLNAQLTELQTKVPDSQNVTFADLTIGQCKFPTTSDHPFLFCGHSQRLESSYCPFHHRLTHENAKPRAVTSYHMRAA